MAFWWARAEEVPGANRDSRILGKANWLQLASWYARNTDRPRITATDPMAQFVDLDVTQTPTNQWSLRLALSDEVVTAKVRGSGERKKRNAPQPGFMTVPFTGDSAALFHGLHVLWPPSPNCRRLMASERIGRFHWCARNSRGGACVRNVLPGWLASARRPVQIRAT